MASGVGIGIDARYEGVDGLIEYLTAWLEPFSDYRAEYLDFIPVGDCVLVPSRNVGIGSASGARTEIELTQLCEVRDGKLVRVDQYETLEEARAEADRRASGA